MNLLDDGDNGMQMSLKVNKTFAKKFENNKKREELEKAKAKYGRNLDKMLDNNEYSEAESSSATEDEDAELLNDEVESKFLKTLAKLRNKDPEIYDSNKTFFTEEDFEIKDSIKKKSDKTKPLTYKELVRQDIRGDPTKPKVKEGETHVEEQERLKKEFKLAAEKKDDEDDNNLFKVRPKTVQEIEDEQKEFQKFLEFEKQRSKPEEVDLLKKFWGDESKLDETDKFLRKYIMGKGWIDREEKAMNEDSEIDKEDEERDEEMEEFEEKYNFRFEEPDADKVMTYARDIPDSLRQKDTKRKEKRKDKEERIKEEVNKEKEELKRLKNIKKQEILEKLAKIEEVAGVQIKEPEPLDELLKTDFDPDEYDNKMKKAFNDDYYEQGDDNIDEIEAYIKKMEEENEALLNKNNEDDETKDPNGNSTKDKTLDSEKDNALTAKTAIPIGTKVQLKPNEAKEIQQAIGQMWWYCDKCIKGIKENEPRFECLECDDYTECKKCAEFKEHPHKMKKFIVPSGCNPPSDDQIRKIIENFKYCAECNYKFTNFDEYYQLKTNQDFYVCEGCLKTNEKKFKPKNFNTVKAKRLDYESLIKENPEKLKEYIKNPEIEELIDSYYKLDFEDIISGGIKTRFKYINVPSNSYGLTDEEIIYADDKLLNDFVSLRQLAPYRPDQGMVEMKKLKRRKDLVKKQAERIKTILNKEIKKEVKSNEKLLLKKKKGLKHNKLELFKKKKSRIDYILNPKKSKAKVDLIIENEMDIEEAQNELGANDNVKNEQSNKKPVSSSRLKSYGLAYKDNDDGEDNKE